MTNQNQLPTPDQARASLDAVDQARRATATLARRPVWLMAALAAPVGVFVGLLTLGDPTAKLVGQIVLFVGLVAAPLAEHRLSRRHGQILDNRFVGAAALRFIPGWILLGWLTTREPPPAWQPRYAIGLGLLTAASAYLLYRWTDNYQARRLAADDYHRAHLL